jgi:hypothetical protein
LPRAYTVATIGFALETDPKWVDNVLSHFAVSGVTQSRQGVARRISGSGALELTLIRRLSETLRVPIEVAVAGARTLIAEGELGIGGGLSLRLDRNEELSRLEARLEAAIEATPVPRRGRPPGKAKRGA